MTSPILMQQNRVRIADIVIGERLRPVSEAGVESLIASITETGVTKDAIHLRKKAAGPEVVRLAYLERLKGHVSDLKKGVA